MTTVSETEFKSAAGFGASAVKGMPQPFELVSFEYSVLRYAHDPATGESLNFGVVVYSSDARFFAFQIHEGISRLKCAFPELDADQHKQVLSHLKGTLRSLQTNIERTPNRFSRPSPKLPDSLQIILHAIWTEAGSSYRYSESSAGVSDNLSESLQTIYARFVAPNAREVVHQRRDDTGLWNATYRKALRKYHVSHLLEKRIIQVNGLELDFRYTFKNGANHILEPVSLDYKETSDISARVVKLVGQADILSRSSEQNELYLLLGKPQLTTMNASYEAAVASLRQNLEGRYEIYEEHQAAQFGERIAAIVEHSDSSKRR